MPPCGAGSGLLPLPAVPAISSRCALRPGLALAGDAGWLRAAATAGMSHESSVTAPGLPSAPVGWQPAGPAGTRLKRALSSGGTSRGRTATTAGEEGAGGCAGAAVTPLAARSSSLVKERHGPLCGCGLECGMERCGSAGVSLRLACACGCHGGLAHAGRAVVPAAGLGEAAGVVPAELSLLDRAQRRAQRSQGGVRCTDASVPHGAAVMALLPLPSELLVVEQCRAAQRGRWAASVSLPADALSPCAVLCTCRGSAQRGRSAAMVDSSPELSCSPHVGRAAQPGPRRCRAGHWSCGSGASSLLVLSLVLSRPRPNRADRRRSLTAAARIVPPAGGRRFRGGGGAGAGWPRHLRLLALITLYALAGRTGLPAAGGPACPLRCSPVSGAAIADGSCANNAVCGRPETPQISLLSARMGHLGAAAPSWPRLQPSAIASCTRAAPRRVHTKRRAACASPKVKRCWLAQGVLACRSISWHRWGALSPRR